jgi:cell wall integrity and stress response component
MKSIYTSTLVAVTALLGASNVAAFTATNDGCYSSTTGLTSNGTNTFNSVGYCSNQCLGMAMAVMAMKDSACYCGQDLPPTSMAVSNSSCTTECPGYPSDICGGSGVYSVYLTGLTTDVTNADPSASDTSSSSSAAKATGKPSTTASASPSVVTVGGQTVVVTASSQATGSSTASSSSSSSGPSKAGIAAGVVIGIVAIAAIAGGGYIFVRNKRRREVEEEYRRNAAVSSFISGGKPPTSSGGASSFTDTRLDPAVMAQRRMSDGSIADNQDYSRRILKVTNA